MTLLIFNFYSGSSTHCAKIVGCLRPVCNTTHSNIAPFIIPKEDSSLFPMLGVFNDHDVSFIKQSSFPNCSCETLPTSVAMILFDDFFCLNHLASRHTTMMRKGVPGAMGRES